MDSFPDPKRFGNRDETNWPNGVWFTIDFIDFTNSFLYDFVDWAAGPYVSHPQMRTWYAVTHVPQLDEKKRKKLKL